MDYAIRMRLHSIYSMYNYNLNGDNIKNKMQEALEIINSREFVSPAINALFEKLFIKMW